MASCDYLHMFCLGILQRSACFFYDIRGGFFSPLSSVLLSLPCGMFPEAFTFGAGVIFQSFIARSHVLGLCCGSSLDVADFARDCLWFTNSSPLTTGCSVGRSPIRFFPSCIADFGQYLPARTRSYIGNLVSLSSLTVKHSHWFVRCRFAAVSFLFAECCVALGPSVCVVSGLHANSSFVRCSCRFIGKYWHNFPPFYFSHMLVWWASSRLVAGFVSIYCPRLLELFAFCHQHSTWPLRISFLS